MRERLFGARRLPDPMLRVVRDRLARLERRVLELERQVAEGYRERP
jgi:hypothetical protein